MEHRIGSLPNDERALAVANAEQRCVTRVRRKFRARSPCQPVRLVCFELGE